MSSSFIHTGIVYGMVINKEANKSNKVVLTLAPWVMQQPKEPMKVLTILASSTGIFTNYNAVN
jgi:hypothetical protein